MKPTRAGCIAPPSSPRAGAAWPGPARPRGLLQGGARRGDGRAHLGGGGAADVVARGDRAFQRQHGVHVVADQRGLVAGPETSRSSATLRSAVTAAPVAGAHRVRHGFVGIAEGQAALDRVVGGSVAVA